jgi:hypothetical protein
MGRVRGKARWRAILGVVGLAAGLLGITAGPASANTPVSGAAFTTVNESVDDAGHCKNGNPGTNCNIYDGKQYVWLNGGPSTAYVGDGTYFFAVLAPGGQADPNDGATKNLSDDFDGHANRTFSVAGGTVSYAGTHDFDNNKIRLMDYADTPNSGGVYILAICSLADGYPANPSDCKYDAFKVAAEQVTPGVPLTVTKDADGAYTKTWQWTIKKDVDKTEVRQSGDQATFNYAVAVSHDTGTISKVTVTGKITVFNPNVDGSNNTVPVDISGVTDTLSDGTTCTVTNSGAQTVTTPKTDFAYTCALSALPQGQLNNTAAVSWGQQLLDNGDLLDASSANFVFKSITFDQTAVAKTASVIDSRAGSLGVLDATVDPSPTTFTYPFTYTNIPAGTCTRYDNTATLTDSNGGTGSAGQTVKVCRGADLTGSVTATPYFTRTYAWSLAKSVDKTLVKQVGGSATFTYAVKTDETGFTDSAWATSGKITVTNPNNWESVTATVSDAVDNGGSCLVGSPAAATASVTVPASGSADVAYSCTWASAPSPTSGTDTATVTWDKTAAYTPDGSATNTAAFAFTTPTKRENSPVTVTDTFNSLTTTLGTVTASDTTPYTSKTFSYSRAVPMPTFGCLSYTNTAKIAQTGQSAYRTITVCGPVKTGALTIGYWQNKNGQAIITGGGSTSGVCNSGTWLRQYLPFQDLSASASCSSMASYVTTVVKAASASGASMNAMLKAQMLATSLDVYFSDASLGGNKIAPAPIGSVTIDLTAICKMIDSTTGSATCGGTYQNVSSAFGGATSLTVSQLLAYAASQSNTGGTTWYGQVKATQEMAKNAFDAVNNQAAFAP